MVRDIFNLQTLLIVLGVMSCLLVQGVEARERATSSKDKLGLTHEEVQFIQQHPKIRVSNEEDWPPFDYTIHGQPAGFSIDYLNLLQEKIGIEFEYVNGLSWTELVDAFKAKEIDVIHSWNETEEHRSYADFTPPFFHNHSVYVVRSSSEEISDLRQFYGKTVAMGAGWSTETYLKKYHPEIQVLVVGNELEMIKAVASGQADATIVYDTSAKYHIARNFFTNLKTSGVYSAEGSQDETLHISTRQDWPLLNSILTKAMHNVSVSESQALSEKWFGSKQSSPALTYGLTGTEWQSIKDKRILRVGFLVDQPPISFKKNDAPAGYLVALFSLLAKELPFTLKWTAVTHQEGINKLNNGKLDAFYSNLGNEHINRSLVDATEVVFESPFVVVSRLNGGDIRSIKQLSGKKVAAVEGFSQQQTLIRQYSDIQQVIYPSIEEAYAGLRSHEVDYYIDNASHAGYIINSQLISDLKIAGSIPIRELGQLRIGLFLQNDLEPLIEVLNQRLMGLSEQDLHALKQKWSVSSSDQHLVLTAEERAFLAQNETVKLCVYPSWMPLMGSDGQGQAEGFGADISALIAQRAGFNLEPVFHQSWNGVYESVIQRECDLAPIVSETPYRAKWLDFTTPYTETLYVIATLEDKPYIDDLENLENTSFAVLSKSLVVDTLQTLPNIKLKEVQTTQEGLDLVLSGDVYGLIDSSSTIGYQISKRSLMGVKINGSTGIWGIASIATRNDQPLLGSIVEKSLASIRKEEIEQIRNRWFLVRYEHGEDYFLLWKVLAFCGLMFIVILIWNRRLAKFNLALGIAHREIRDARDRTEVALSKVETFLNNSGEGFLSIYDNLSVDEEYSQECLTILENKGSLAGRNAVLLLFPYASREKDSFIRGCELLFSTRDKQKVNLYLELMPNPILLGDKVISIKYAKIEHDKMMLVLSDISEQVNLEQEVKREQYRMKAIVNAVQNRDELIEFIGDYRFFSGQLLPKLLQQKLPLLDLISTIYRHIHTFKGLAMQAEFQFLAEALHDLEDQLDNIRHLKAEGIRPQFNKIINSLDFEEVLQKDLLALLNVLGSDYFSEDKTFTVTDTTLDSLLSSVRSIGSPMIRDQLLHELQSIRSVNLIDMISPHVKPTYLAAKRLGKELLPFHVEGSSVLVDRDLVAPFCKQLLHVFRNCIDHGVECPERRLTSGKPIHGAIRCRVRIVQGEQNKEHVEITVSDDGQGIRTDLLKEKVVTEGKMSQAEIELLTADEIILLILKDFVSTKESVGEYSGRGIGLSSVIWQLEQLGGSCRIDTREGLGTQFQFTIPRDRITLNGHKESSYPVTEMAYKKQSMR